MKGGKRNTKNEHKKNLFKKEICMKYRLMILLREIENRTIKNNEDACLSKEIMLKTKQQKHI